MYECVFQLKKKVGNTVHKLTLDRNEVREIWAFYEEYLTDENIWNKLKDDYGLADFAKCEDVVDAISHRYKKCVEWGSDHEFSLDEAFSENQEKIDELVKQMEGSSA